MFSALSERLTGVLRGLAGRGVLSEDDVDAALREVRRHLLEADVSLDVVRRFTEQVRERAIGAIRLKPVTPGQQVVKVVHDELAAMLGAGAGTTELAFAPVGQTIVLLVGLQGSGKTTTAAKLARRLEREQKAPALVAADVQRPAAADQLEQLGAKVGVPVFGRRDTTDVVALVREALRAAEQARRRTILVDTAGRLQIDEPLMEELKALKSAVAPAEVLLVADGMTGQDAVRSARGFHEALGLTGAVLTKLDGDARGGAALSIYGATGVPIRFAGTGEAVDALEPFDPVRMAGRILGQGDVVGLVERAAATVDAEAAERIGKKVKSRRGMDLEDFLAGLRQMQSMGPLKQLAGLLPGVNAKMLTGAKVDDRQLKHIEAIILSMTRAERSNPAVLDGSRRRRIARGSGRPVQEINRVLAQFDQMRKLMKRM